MSYIKNADDKKPGSQMKEKRNVLPVAEPMSVLEYDTPKKIYEFLNSRVYKQKEAKKVASIIAYKVFVRGIRENCIFVGPSGCGKTYIWQVLKEIFPERIEIIDTSNITMDGWSGGKKWENLFQSPIFRSGKKCVLVLDEADKMLAVKHGSDGVNYSHAIQGEGLKILEGTTVYIEGENQEKVPIDTSNISFILCGAFYQKAKEMEEEANKIQHTLGFCDCSGEEKTVQAYERKMTHKDLLDFGVIPEFLGRFQEIVNLERITKQDYLRMLDTGCSPVERLKEIYESEITLSPEKKLEIAEEASRLELGVRGMENQIRKMIDNQLFTAPKKRKFYF